METVQKSVCKSTILCIVLLTFAGSALAQAPADVFALSLSRHGGESVRTVQTVRLTGQTSSRGTKTDVVISADLDGFVRYDYGQPVTRSVIHTPKGEIEKSGDALRYRSRHVGLFAGLDLLSILGLRRLETAGTVWGEAKSETESGRSVVKMRAETSQQSIQYGRVLKDAADIRIDGRTGWVSSIERLQYAANSLDLAFPVRYAFSDYREIGGLAFPFHIEKYVRDRLVEALTITSLEVNPSVPRSVFDPSGR
jgi:hypothetical protein